MKAKAKTPRAPLVPQTADAERKEPLDALLKAKAKFTTSIAGFAKGLADADVKRTGPVDVPLKAKAKARAKTPPSQLTPRTEAHEDVKQKEPLDVPLDEQLIQACADICDAQHVADLLKQGASPRYVLDPEGVWGSCNTRTALHVALGNIGRSTADSEGYKVVRMLVEAGADVNAVRKEYDWRRCGRSESAFDMLLQRDGGPRPARTVPRSRR